ncbi:MAG TPA: DUF885 domain-containing protein [Kofleriaceae bacterium]|nr:DUF885 domain-containing protein [Kofleriaceae bacterium]
MLRTLAVVAALAPAACGSPATPGPASPAPSTFEATASAITDRLLAANPAMGVAKGLHELDGRLPDRSPAALAAEVDSLRRDRAALEAFDPRVLSPVERDERALLLQEVRGLLFARVDLDVFHTNPMSYSSAIDLHDYIVRDYAPLTQRAAAVIALCHGLPGYLAQARANLARPMPRTWVDTALLQTRGYAELVAHDIPFAFPSDVPLANAADLERGLATCKAALAQHADWLVHEQGRATDAFALGTDRFLRMLAEDEGIALDLPRLQQAADADLARNTAAIEAAGKSIDPARPLADVVHEIDDDKPAADRVLAEATAQAAQLRTFLVAHHIVSLPYDDVAEVKTSPPFQRWNAAFLNAPGVFETKQLPSFFYISPPDPSWSPADQRAYIPSRSDLLFVTVHEVYPGHFVHHLHIKHSPSRILKTFCMYTTSEGWAHYAEEMMWDQGAAGDSPRAHVGQLEEALLRDVRFEVAIGEHTGGMTVAQAEKLFRERGFQDPGNAHQQAVRGTFDPMFLAYTVGKLAIRKLRDDWMAAHPGASLQDFHDAFLSHACAPLPAIREALLGDSAGPLL